MATVVLYTKDDTVLHVQCNIARDNITTHKRIVGMKYSFIECLFKILDDDLTPRQFKELYTLTNGKFILNKVKVSKSIADLTSEITALDESDVDEFVIKNNNKDLIIAIIKLINRK